ncbi:MAG TPA: hypothetical protein VNR17_10190 [Luteimicrobium sp.]|nr:hypothetical protein [Luteimicrobium sp.]
MSLLEWEFEGTGWVAHETGGDFRVTLLENGKWEVHYPSSRSPSTTEFETPKEAKDWAESWYREWR